MPAKKVEHYSNEKMFREITKNKNKDSWKNLIKSLELMKDLPTRKYTLTAI